MVRLRVWALVVRVRRQCGHWGSRVLAPIDMVMRAVFAMAIWALVAMVRRRMWVLFTIVRRRYGIWGCGVWALIHMVVRALVAVVMCALVAMAMCALVDTVRLRMWGEH
jgi:hypothetical protein